VSRELRVRVLLAVAVLLLLRIGFSGTTDPLLIPGWSGLGLVLFVLGLGLRWSGPGSTSGATGHPMSQKDDRSSSPAAPIGSSAIRSLRDPLASVGTALALSWVWLVVVALAGGYFVYAAPWRSAT